MPTGLRSPPWPVLSHTCCSPEPSIKTVGQGRGQRGLGGSSSVLGAVAETKQQPDARTPGLSGCSATYWLRVATLCHLGALRVHAPSLCDSILRFPLEDHLLPVALPSAPAAHSEHHFLQHQGLDQDWTLSLIQSPEERSRGLLRAAVTSLA